MTILKYRSVCIGSVDRKIWPLRLSMKIYRPSLGTRTHCLTRFRLLASKNVSKINSCMFFCCVYESTDNEYCSGEKVATYKGLQFQIICYVWSLTYSGYLYSKIITNIFPRFCTFYIFLMFNLNLPT